jgi:hypothetical protein
MNTSATAVEACRWGARASICTLFSALSSWVLWAILVLVVNGVSSIATALWTAVDPGWMMTSIGIVGYTAWNVLVLALASIALVVFRRRGAATANLAPRRKVRADSVDEYDGVLADETRSVLSR